MASIKSPAVFPSSFLDCKTFEFDLVTVGCFNVTDSDATAT